MRDYTYIFIDVEATLIRGKQYIIEIGAVKWLPNGSKEAFSQLIKPYKFKKLNSHIQKLTGITTEQLTDAPSFKEVFGEFINWCNGKTIFVTFGEFDRKVLEEELRRNNVNSKFLYPIVDFQQKYMIDKQIKEQPGLGKMLEKYNIAVETQHRALADALSLLNVFEATDGDHLILNQQTDEFAFVLSELRQIEEENCYHLTLSYISGNVSNTKLSIESINSINKQLKYDIQVEERTNKEGEVEVLQRTVVQPDKEIEHFLKQVNQNLANKVLITRSGLKQLSRINRMHQCTIPKTEVMTLQNLVSLSDDLNDFTLSSDQSMASYEGYLKNLIKKYENNIIREFRKRHLITKVKVTM